MGSSGPLTTAKANPEVPDLAEEGAYFTDGTNLFRVANVTSGPRSRKLIELEDCRTLDVSLCGREGLVGFELVAATPERAGDACRSDEGRGGFAWT